MGSHPSSAIFYGCKLTLEVSEDDWDDESGFYEKWFKAQNLHESIVLVWSAYYDESEYFLADSQTLQRSHEAASTTIRDLNLLARTIARFKYLRNKYEEVLSEPSFILTSSYG